MALLQIAEPGQTPQPHQRRLAVGIDLGTTNSLVAALRSGISEPLPDAEGRVILPSAVRYHADRVEVGEIAKMAAAMKTHGALAGIQLAYSGINGPNMYTKEVPLAPSALKPASV